MNKDLKAFQIEVNGRILDYRLGRDLDLNDVRNFFEKNYNVTRIWKGARHVLGLLEKYNHKLILKLSTTEGMSAITQNEYEWNKQCNELLPRKISDYWIPKNIDSGFYKNKLFYLITERFEGQFIVSERIETKISPTFIEQIPNIIEFSEIIQKLPITNISEREDADYRNWFIIKTKTWLSSIPEKIKEMYNLHDLYNLVKKQAKYLQKKPRHGDFAPWHLIKLTNNKLGLIDGEHAVSNGVEYYDIGYFIQRVYSVMKNPELPEDIIYQLKAKNYEINNLRAILCARAIGGFLDQSLLSSPDYDIDNKFREWALKVE